MAMGVVVAQGVEEIFDAIENVYDDGPFDDSTSKTLTCESTGRGLLSEEAAIIFGGDIERLGGETWGIVRDITGL